jgi:hypothetical protein
MKVALLVLLFATSAFAQDPKVDPTAACGPENMYFNVNLDKSQHTPLPQVPGKARIYFIQNVNTDIFDSYTMTRFGIDGAWVGANNHNSYFSVSVEPGEHHLCASIWYSRIDQHLVLAHLTAEPGKVYYYRLGIIETRNLSDWKLDQIDSDEARYLITLYPLSVSTAKK